MTTEDHVLYKIYTRMEWRTEGPLPITQLDQRSDLSISLRPPKLMAAPLNCIFHNVEHVIVGFNRSDLGEELVLKRFQQERCGCHIFTVI